MLHREIEIRKGSIDPSHYQYLREQTGWSMQSEKLVPGALNRDLFSVTVLHNHQPIGMGRIIGDGLHYFYIQDIIVDTAYRSMGIGMIIMKEIESYLSNYAPDQAFIGLMAADRSKGFYRKMGYVERPSSRPGMYKIMDHTNKS